ncbi:MAG: hypothetical protein JNL80_12830 [Phycisphaerae bacterium]|jgi:hypothetical protein|nr:hypothetical protein [Phycisphaerae bacterium]
MDDRQTIDNPAERPDSSDAPVESAIGLATDGHVATESHPPTSSECASVVTPDGMTRKESVDGVGTEPSPSIDPNESASRETNPNPLESPVEPDGIAPPSPAAEAEASLDQMRALLDEVRTMVSDPSGDSGELLHAVCNEEALAEHGAEIDQLLNEFLDPNVSSNTTAPPRDSAVASADEALAAVETAMTSLTGAIESDSVIEPAPAAEPSQSPEAPPADAVINEAPPTAEAVEAPTVPAPENQANAAPTASDERPSAESPAPAASPEPVPEPTAVATAAAAMVAAQVPESRPTEPRKPASAPAVPTVSAVKRMTANLTRIASTLSFRTRSALTGVASLLPQKFRMLGGVAALTLFIWVPVVWWMAKTIAANDRVRPLTDAELHHLVESTHAAAAAGAHGDAKSEKKDDGHGEKSDKKDSHGEKKDADHKPAKKDDGHGAKDAKKPAKDAGHGGGH